LLNSIDSTQKWLMGSVLGLLPTVMAWLPAKATLGLFDWVFVGVILLVVTFLLEFVNFTHGIRRHRESSRIKKVPKGMWI